MVLGSFDGARAHVRPRPDAHPSPEQHGSNSLFRGVTHRASPSVAITRIFMIIFRMISVGIAFFFVFFVFIIPDKMIIIFFSS